MIRLFKNIIESVFQVFSGKGKKKKDNRDKKSSTRKKEGRNVSGNGKTFTGNGKQDHSEKKKNGKNHSPAERKTAAPEKKRRIVPPVPDLVDVPDEPGKVRMNSLPLAREILGAVQTLNFKYCTPIQAQCLPAALEGKDLAAKAQTGTGKTAAFLASSMTRLLLDPLPPEKRRKGACRVLVLSPTRELAIQIKNDADKLSKKD